MIIKRHDKLYDYVWRISIGSSSHEITNWIKDWFGNKNIDITINYNDGWRYIELAEEDYIRLIIEMDDEI